MYSFELKRYKTKPGIQIILLDEYIYIANIEIEFEPNEYICYYSLFNYKDCQDSGCYET